MNKRKEPVTLYTICRFRNGNWEILDAGSWMPIFFKEEEAEEAASISEKREGIPYIAVRLDLKSNQSSEKLNAPLGKGLGHSPL